MKSITMGIMIVLMCFLFFFAFLSVKDSINTITAKAVQDTDTLFEDFNKDLEDEKLNRTEETIETS